MSEKNAPQLACETIQSKAPDFVPKVGLILGSGLGQVANQINAVATIPYREIPGFPLGSVEGHSNQLILGELGPMPVACMQGRVHLYEGQQSWEQLKTAIRTLKLLGCETLIVTNAAGSFHHEIGPGHLMLINDHINLQPGNPLVGPNDDQFGPRFVSMEDAYDPKLRKIFKNSAKQLSIPLGTGTYLAVSGPVFETPAEIHAFRSLGADAVGMSTVPEVIIARHCDLQVAAISIISNLAVGLSDTKITHEQTLEVAKKSEASLIALLTHVLEQLSSE